ncbi:uncharacterized protein VTP21DRAFT_9998 [Calcarisporiella thermophila]|uniref:uncharacterized protein n=1 Tax=Calcarisporiella thermophila TaxID=911321 RepID=UPI00374341A8
MSRLEAVYTVSGTPAKEFNLPISEEAGQHKPFLSALAQSLSQLQGDINAHLTAILKGNQDDIEISDEEEADFEEEEESEENTCNAEDGETFDVSTVDIRIKTQWCILQTSTCQNICLDGGFDVQVNIVELFFHLRKANDVLQFPILFARMNSNNVSKTVHLGTPNAITAALLSVVGPGTLPIAPQV